MKISTPAPVVSFDLNASTGLPIIAAQNAAKASGLVMTGDDIRTILTGNGVTMAGVIFCTEITPAATHKHTVTMRKVTYASVQLFSRIVDRELYTRQVLRSAGIEPTSAAIANWQKSPAWFEHTETYSLVRHPKTGTEYLYAVFNSARSECYLNGKGVTRQACAEFMTPSGAKALLDLSGVTYNASNDLEHKLVLRTITLENVVSLRAKGLEYTI